MYICTVRGFVKFLIFIILFNVNFAQCDGDANLDEVINIQDIISVINHILGSGMLIDDGLINADINNDSDLDILDIVGIVDIILVDDQIECESSIFLDLSLEWEFEDNLSYFDFQSLNNIINAVHQNLDYIKGLIVIHKGKVVGEEYYNNSTQNDIYNVWSVTKSYISTLIGQAIDQGFIEDTDIALSNLLPTYGQSYLDNVELKDVLSMSSGYFDGFGSYPAWLFATTQQLVWMPYTFPGTFMYNNSACHLNSHVLYYNTNMTPLEFANINLFPYLGIEDPYWEDGYNYINDGSASLKLTLREMVKLGQLYLQDGFSGADQILSIDWIQQSTSTQVFTGFGEGYGYLWWLPGEGYSAIGYGGQIIAVIPELELVVGVRSQENNSSAYLEGLHLLIYNDIAPLFAD